MSRLLGGGRGGSVQPDDTIEKLSSEEVPSGTTQWEAGVGVEEGGGCGWIGNFQFLLAFGQSDSNQFSPDEKKEVGQKEWMAHGEELKRSWLFLVRFTHLHLGSQHGRKCNIKHSLCRLTEQRSKKR